MSDFGFCLSAVQDYTPADLTRMLSEAKQLGATRQRIVISWKFTAPSKTTRDWSVADALVAGCQAAGLRPLIVLYEFPGWGGSAADFGQFAGEVANRYKDVASDFEIWNEQNHFIFGKGVKDPATYVQYLAMAYAQIKSILPADRSTVVLGGFNPTGDAFSFTTSPKTMLAAYYANGGKPFFDAAAMHPYTGGELGDSTGDPSDNSVYIRAMNDMRAIMVANGDANKKIWVTEFGWGTDGQATEAQQALWIGHMFDLLATKPWAGPAFIYNYRDSDKNASGETGYGIVRRDFTRKAAWGYLSTSMTPSIVVPMMTATAAWWPPAMGNGETISVPTMGTVDLSLTGVIGLPVMEASASMPVPSLPMAPVPAMAATTQMFAPSLVIQVPQMGSLVATMYPPVVQFDPAIQPPPMIVYAEAYPPDLVISVPVIATAYNPAGVIVPSVGYQDEPTAVRYPGPSVYPSSTFYPSKP